MNITINTWLLLVILMRGFINSCLEHQGKPHYNNNAHNCNMVIDMLSSIVYFIIACVLKNNEMAVH